MASRSARGEESLRRRSRVLSQPGDRHRQTGHAILGKQSLYSYHSGRHRRSREHREGRSLARTTDRPSSDGKGAATARRNQGSRLESWPPRKQLVLMENDQTVSMQSERIDAHHHLWKYSAEDYPWMLE